MNCCKKLIWKFLKELGLNYYFIKYSLRCTIILERFLALQAQIIIIMTVGITIPSTTKLNLLYYIIISIIMLKFKRTQ